MSYQDEQPRFGDFGSDAPMETVGHQRMSWLALTSFITGLLALPVCCVPIVGSAFALVPAGLGVGGLVAVRRSGGLLAGRSLAITGLLLGIVVLLASSVGWVVFGGQLSKMPAVYHQVLADQPSAARTVLTSDAATEVSDEQLAAFRAAFIAEHGEPAPSPAGILPVVRAYEAANRAGLPEIAPPDQRLAPFPIPVETADGDVGVMVVFLDAEQTLGSGLPAMANVAFQTADGQVVWLIPPASPETDPADEPADAPAEPLPGDEAPPVEDPGG